MSPTHSKHIEAYSLFDLNEYIRQVLQLNFPTSVWVQAEIVQSGFSRSHCYLSLLQKAADSDEIIAQAQAVIWAGKMFSLRKKIGESLHSLLEPGTEVQLQVEVSFHERYGLKLIVLDIDPYYTLGKLELLRRKTIEALQQQNLLNRNRQLPLPPVIQRIAVLSSPSAAGYADFTEQLQNNQQGYLFEMKLFPTAMQGQMVEEEFLQQLQKIEPDKFDIAVVLRGGGARLDLAAFDKFSLCEAVAHCALPVVTGIGHEVDQSVLDMVAFAALKTPTAVAEYILQHNLLFETELLRIAQQIRSLSATYLNDQALRLQQISLQLKRRADSELHSQNLLLTLYAQALPIASQQLTRHKATLLDGLEKSLALLNPVNILQRGYALVRRKGVVIHSAAQLSEGEQIETSFHDGSINSTVNRKIYE